MCTIEFLEPRIAPAFFTLPYTDYDGDHVKVTVTVPGAVAPPFDMSDLTVINGQLVKLNLTDAGFQNVSVGFLITKAAGGDGFAHVGYIDATGRDLGVVTVKGDLGAIDAGDANTAATSPAVKTLSARSMGVYGSATQFLGDLVSNLKGMVGAVTVSGDVKDAQISVSGGADGRIGSVTIGGSLLGGGSNFSGTIQATGDIGPVKIGHDAQGGAGQESGRVQSDAGKITASPSAVLSWAAAGR